MNVFPVVVVRDGQKIAVKARVVAGPDGTVSIWQWANGGAVLVAEGHTVETVNARTWTVQTDDGELTVSRQGCSTCGHPLKRWRPPGETGAHREYA